MIGTCFFNWPRGKFKLFRESTAKDRKTFSAAFIGLITHRVSTATASPDTVAAVQADSLHLHHKTRSERSHTQRPRRVERASADICDDSRTFQ